GDGHVTGVRVAETTLGAPDANGRRNAVIVEGSETVLDADVVIIAFGFQAEAPEWLARHGVSLAGNGRILTSGEHGAFAYQTAHPRLFAGGDCVRGADLVVTATFEGREAAAGIARYLASQPVSESVSASKVDAAA
ncbi:MAG: FAD-dependent oxidoreductase, partial [Lysobacter sp.]|nr:FAD-dependent oxidoreductase [Lysobacter sp.]